MLQQPINSKNGINGRICVYLPLEVEGFEIFSHLN